MSKDQRKFPRTPLEVNVKVMHSSFGTLTCKVKDISDGGMFIVHEGIEFPPIGAEMQVQALDVPIEAPVLTVRVAHKRSAGTGVEFC